MKYLAHIRFAIATLMLTLCAMPSGAWSAKGHQISAYIAKTHLTTKAWYAVDDLLDGDSMVYWASWLDTVRDEAQYTYTVGWHYINVDEDECYEDRIIPYGGDAVTAIKDLCQLLTDENVTKEEKSLAVKILTHIVADVHQPMHAGHRSDLGGNNIRLKYEGDWTSLHSLWDYTIVQKSHAWNYYEWATTLSSISDKDKDDITTGNIDDWAHESVDTATDIYNYFHYGMTVTDTDIDFWTPVVEQQLLNGGLRLATLLNNALDPDASGVELSVDTDGRADVYTITGTCILRGVTVEEAIGRLPKGLYIHGQHKIAVMH